MIACKRLGGDEVTLLHYSTSGETTGDFNEVVGYMSAAVTSGKKPSRGRGLMGTPKAEAPRKADDPLSDRHKESLKKIAFDAIKARLEGSSYAPPDVEWLTDRKGLFVTLEIDGDLRGCIGQIRATDTLPKLTSEMAVAAAFEDPRFPALGADELKRIDISLSVLSPIKRVRDLKEIEVGKHGLMIKLDNHSGLLLPQVATEQNWDRQTFLEQTCLKAGLARNSYNDSRAEIYCFTAEVF